ncbi:MAG TPA: GMC family oxidoreductase [Bryobacteraceae bacterium]|nr:GMC family oxidoreductase [Bryobacteraceae bacterium]
MPALSYDVLIIGSGASGGMAAYTLAKLGVKCLMLDAGAPIDFDHDRVPRPVYDLPYRGFGRPGRFPHITQANEFNANIWADETQNPYSYDPADPYYWVRVRRIGGKTLVWGRASWRLTDYEFKARDRDGFGDNWPLAYADLAPYYDKCERLFHVGEDPAPDSVSLARFIAAARQRGVPAIKPRRAMGRLASSLNILLPDAVATGNLTIVPNAVVRRIVADKKTGLANGADFIDRHSGRELHAAARVVVVGASCLESTRLLLNSKIANSSGVLGHYLFDQFYVKNTIQAVVPEARDGKGAGNLMGGAGYIPRFRNLETKAKDFIRGYSVDFSSGGTPDPKYFPVYGEALQKAVNTHRGTGFSATTMGSVLPRFENHVIVDPNVIDAWGIPSLRIHARYTENEFNMARDAMRTLDELSHDAGFEVLEKHEKMVPPGESIHELGTCRMGDDPKTSVLNRWNQSHDMKNLFVVDGGSFVCGGSQNPTLTILALSMRASDYLAEQLRTRNL